MRSARPVRLVAEPEVERIESRDMRNLSPGEPKDQVARWLSCPLFCLPVPEKNKRLRRVQSDQVIYRMAEILFAAQVALGCLHGNMPQ